MDGVADKRGKELHSICFRDGRLEITFLAVRAGSQWVGLRLISNPAMCGALFGDHVPPPDQHPPTMVLKGKSRHAL